MFYIDQTTSNFVRARDEHYRNIRYIVKKKLLGNAFTEPHPKGETKRINKVNKIPTPVFDFLNDEDNLKNVLIGTPDVLDTIKNRFSSKKQRTSLKILLRYESFIDTNKDSAFNFYNAYHLAENTPIGTCIYCNRLYTHTIITDSREYIARPTFDHWFPKSEYPLLSLSFYNLIPSCNVCNSSVKGATTLKLSDIFNPYVKHPNPDKQLRFRFSYTLEDHQAAECKIVTNNKFTEDTVVAMKIREIYKSHHEEIRELIYLKKAYTDSYLSSLKSLLSVNLTPSEIYRLAFGVFLDDDQLFMRPLSKLKKDILDELGMLK